MRGVAATAEYLNEAGAFGIDGNVRRAIEAGVIVVYSRPFIASRGLPSLSPASGLGAYLRSIHDQVLLERRTTYAHTDENAYRLVLELEEPDWLDRFIDLLRSEIANRAVALAVLKRHQQRDRPGQPVEVAPMLVDVFMQALVEPVLRRVEDDRVVRVVVAVLE
jgi:hypothetical protein